MVGRAARARDALVALGITLALLLIAGFTVLALAYAVKSGIEGKWTDAYDAAKRGGEGLIGLAVVVYVCVRSGLVAVRRTWLSTAEIARDRGVEDARVA